MKKGIYKLLFFWPYRLCQWIARGLFYCGVNLGLATGVILLTMILIVGLEYKGYPSFFQGVSGLVYSLLLEWFGFYLFLACLSLIQKHAELCRSIKQLSEKPPSDLIGINPVTCCTLHTKDFVQDDHWKVIGNEESLRNLIQPFLEADARKGRSIIILAPEGEEGLLEEITFILRERDKEEYRPFFYYSLNRPELSASYSPFFGSHGVNLIRVWVDLKHEDEFKLMDSLLDGLKELKKPFDLTDLLLLLRDKNAIYALCDFEGMQNYLKNFHAYPDVRRSLAEKLEEFGKKLKLEHYPVHGGYPLDVPNIFAANKHLYIEFGKKASSLTSAFLLDVIWEMRDRFGKSLSIKPFVYLIYPEKIEEHYQIKHIVEKLIDVSFLRIFSQQYFPYEKDYWSSIVAPGAVVTEEACQYRKSSFQQIEDERKRSKKNSGFFSVLNDETFEAAECVMRKMNLKPAYMFFHYWRRESGHQWQCSPFLIPVKNRPKLNYEPYQKRYASADMLNLQDLVRGKKRKNHDPGVMDIIKGFKPPQKQKGS